MGHHKPSLSLVLSVGVHTGHIALLPIPCERLNAGRNPWLVLPMCHAGSNRFASVRVSAWRP